jgi:hypothetical protein
VVGVDGFERLEDVCGPDRFVALAGDWDHDGSLPVGHLWHGVGEVVERRDALL